MTEIARKVMIDFEASEIFAAETVAEWGKTLIVAPHPDDESLGCGGALALLKKLGCEVIALTMSDGTLSHPNSVKYPFAKLRDTRENEMRRALEILGVAPDKISFLRFRDRSVPGKESADYAAAVEKVREYLDGNQPQTILLPWRRDPHPDHRATWQIFSGATRFFENRFRVLEYPIWLWEMAETADLPTGEKFRIQRLNIESVTEIKQRAIRAHVSQVTDLIDDDPHGFRLSPEVLAHFAASTEVYIEEIK